MDKQSAKLGVYRDLPLEEYLAEPHISSSDLRRALTSPASYWHYSTLNPDRPSRRDSETPAMAFGKHLHAAILEPLRFNDTYVELPDSPGQEAWLTTKDDLLKECKRLKLPLTGNKPELIERISEYFADKNVPGPNITDVVKAESEKKGYTLLKSDEFWRVKERQALAAFFYGKELLGDISSSEVSIFWIDKKFDLPCKARLDKVIFFLKNREGRIIELKSIAEKSSALAFRAGRAISTYGYDVQASFYLRGLLEIQRANLEHELFKTKKINDSLPADNWLLDFLFVQSTGPAEMIKLRWAGNDVSDENASYRLIANQRVDRALQIIHDGHKEHPDGQSWLSGRSLELTGNLIPPYQGTEDY